MAARTCMHCGNALPEHARFCGQCGTVTPPGYSRPAGDAQSPGGAPGGASPPQPAAPVPPPVQPKGLRDLTKTIVDPPRFDPPAAQPGRAPVGHTMVGFAAPSSSHTPVATPAFPVDEGPSSSAATPIATPIFSPSPAPGISSAHAPTPAAPFAPAPAPARLGVKGTMIGFAAPELREAVANRARSAPTQIEAPPAPVPAPVQPAPALAPAPAPTFTPFNPPNYRGTMMGVAMPGIAPTAAGAPSAPPQAPPPAIRPQQTMMGVAMPGIAPTNAGHPGQPPGAPGYGSPPNAHASVRPDVPLRRAVEIAPMPPPLVDDEPLPAPPMVVPKSGVPLGVLGGILGVLVLVAGGLVAFFWKSPPLVAQPQLDAQGHDQLHLTCSGCPDGTTAEAYGQKVTFAAKTADLPLTTPLKVGDNKLIVHLDRPSLGRDEAIDLTVPLTYRVRADLTEIGAPHPVITVRVEAIPGTDVLLDGKPVALDSSGSGAYAIDISAETEGTAEDVRVVERSIPYVVTPKAGTPQKGNVSAKVGVTPLRLEAPGTRPVIDTPTFHVAGRTAKATAAGGPVTTVTVNGKPVQVGSDGVFAEPVDAPALGDLPVELRASAPQLAPRTAHFSVKRVEHLETEAKAREALPAVGYDAVAANVAGSVGQAVIAEGDVVEARSANQQTVALIDDSRGCAKGPCIIRVVTGGETVMKRGDAVRAYGRITRAVTSGGRTVPEMEADFVVKGGSGSHHSQAAP